MEYSHYTHCQHIITIEPEQSILPIINTPERPHSRNGLKTHFFTCCNSISARHCFYVVHERDIAAEASRPKLLNLEFSNHFSRRSLSGKKRDRDSFYEGFCSVKTAFQFAIATEQPSNIQHESRITPYLTALMR